MQEITTLAARSDGLVRVLLLLFRGHGDVVVYWLYRRGDFARLCVRLCGFQCCLVLHLALLEWRLRLRDLVLVLAVIRHVSLCYISVETYTVDVSKLVHCTRLEVDIGLAVGTLLRLGIPHRDLGTGHLDRQIAGSACAASSLAPQYRAQQHQLQT
jgi:hypothetical protein